MEQVEEKFMWFRVRLTFMTLTSFSVATSWVKRMVTCSGSIPFNYKGILGNKYFCISVLENVSHPATDQANKIGCSVSRSLLACDSLACLKSGPSPIRPHGPRPHILA
jgi:hypothetical protein